MITTREAIEQERRILKAMDTGAVEARPLMSADVAATRLAELAAPRELNHQQLAAAIQIVSSPDRIVLFQGRAGAGKSTMLLPIAKEIGRAHVCTPVPHAHLVCRLLLDQKTKK